MAEERLYIVTEGGKPAWVLVANEKGRGVQVRIKVFDSQVMPYGCLRNVVR